jgi:peptide/nickel transport system substrate-binding protein
MAHDGWTRRDFLVRGTQLTALALAAPAALVACTRSAGGGASTSGSNSAGGGTPVKGGTFTVGMVGTGAVETVDPATASSIADYAPTFALFDRLFDVGADIKTLVPRLARSAETNADATVWTFHLRDGVTWHDGKPLTADDVVYSIQGLGSQSNYGYGLVGTLIDFRNVRKRDKLTVEVPLRSANTELPALLTGINAAIVQNGSTSKQRTVRPVGTGPFVFQSFTAGQQSVFTANRSYWEEGKPYVDKLIIDSSFSDVVAQANALRGGQINILPQLPYTQVASVSSQGGISVIRSAGVAAQYIKMRTDKGPLTDQRVRLALQLVTDRQGLVDGVLNGYGTVAYDLLAPKTNYFASDLTRGRDVEQAKSLLRAAGKEGLSIKITTSNAFPGSVESATLYAHQAKDAGINVEVDTLTASAIATAYLPAPFANAYTAAEPSLDAVYRGLMASDAVYPETGWGTAAHDAAVAAAVGATDATKATSLWRSVQETWFNGGPYIVWGYADNIDALSSKVRGLTVTAAGNLNNFRFQDGWLAS